MDSVKEQTSKTSPSKLLYGEESDWLPAKIKWYSLSKGFGFVYVEKTEAFLHAHELRKAGFTTIRDGQEVKVKLRPNGLRFRVTSIRPGE